MISLTFSDFSAIIDEQHGANCVSLKNNRLGVSILHESDENPYLVGMPILFPVNRISGGCFSFEGRKYIFPINEPSTNCHIHGSLHTLPFKILEQTDNKVVLEFEATEDKPYLSFPHTFKVQITYVLTDNGMEHTTKITNTSNLNMPIMLGFHTTFNLPFSENSSAENCRIRADVGTHYERRLDTDFLPTGRILPKDSIEEQLNMGEFAVTKISRLQKAINDGIMSIVDKATGLCVEYKNDLKYKFRLLYSDNSNKFICLEPNTCLADCLNTNINGNGFDYIEPNKSKQYVSTIILKRYNDEKYN